MARIELPPGDFEEPYRLFMLAPEIAGPAGAFSEAVYTKSSLSIRLRELLRMRIAQINQCVV
jgi:alkylhydroperoxidase family enzyme